MHRTSTWPIASAQKRTLSFSERAIYLQKGYLRIEHVFSDREIASISIEVDRLRQEQNDADGPHYIAAVGTRSPIMEAICRDERILDLIEGIVKPGIAIFSAKLSEKLPRSNTICHWHQDNAYFNFRSISSCRMSVLIALQRADEANGCLWVVPGSHGRGLVTPTRQRDGTCTLAVANGREEIEGAIACPMEAGDALLFDAWLWHRSLGNRTDQTRRFLITSYQEAACPEGNKEQHKILRPG